MKSKTARQIKQELRNPDPRIREGIASWMGSRILAQDIVAELLAITDVVREDAAKHQTDLGEYTVSLCEKAVHSLAATVEQLSAGQCRAVLQANVQEAYDAIDAWVRQHGATPNWLESPPDRRPERDLISVPVYQIRKTPQPPIHTPHAMSLALKKKGAMQ